MTDIWFLFGDFATGHNIAVMRTVGSVKIACGCASSVVKHTGTFFSILFCLELGFVKCTLSFFGENNQK